MGICLCGKMMVGGCCQEDVDGKMLEGRFCWREDFVGGKMLLERYL